MQTVNFNYFPLSDGDRVLDLGCGEGRHAIHAYILKDIELIAIDLSFSDVKITRKNSLSYLDNTRNNTFQVLQGSGLCLPFANNSFDKVICSEVLEHIEYYEQVLKEIFRVLKPNGLLCVSVPRYWTEKICWLLSGDYSKVEGGHIRIFKDKQLRKTIGSSGFNFRMRHYAHALHSPYWWLKCIFWKTQDSNGLIRVYHRLLVWDLMKKPWLTQCLEKILNPILGKSVVLYFNKKLCQVYKSDDDGAIE